MKYGYFDDEAREYVITNPDTPEPWANYLGSVEYGAIISNNAGGYSFRKSGANGRILRYVFNDFDQPGRYFYLRDDDSADFWSASWMPVAKPLDQYKNKCRHGLGYSIIEADYSKIHSEASYYVPDGALYEVWALTVRNDDTVERHLTLTGFGEFTNESNYEQDQVNLQYTLFISRTLYEKNRIRQLINGNLDVQTAGSKSDGNSFNERFFAMVGAEAASYSGDKKSFLGSCRGYNAPDGIVKGDLGNQLNYNGNSCGAMSAKVSLAPGEEKTLVFLLGMLDEAESSEVMAKYPATTAASYSDCDADPLYQKVQSEINALREMWNDRLDAFYVKTPSPEFNTMINTWNAYNCFMTFLWSRAASFIYCGLRNGYGYRDTVQDIQGIIHLEPEMAADRIRFMLSAQVDNGGGLPLVKFTHNPGHEDTPDDESYRQSTGHPAYRADDALWLFPTIWKYLSESGNKDFLKEDIVFANKDHGSVYEHLKRALHFSKTHLGPHGMPAGLYADWNDCLRLGANGESTFVAFQYYYAMTIMKRLATELGDSAYIAELDEEQERLGKILNEECWKGDRFLRGFTEEGEAIGDPNAPEANMWLNPQSWSIISGLATEEQSEKALEQVEKRLNTEYGVVLMDPPYHAHAFDGALAVIFNQGVKENAGIFSQTQGWIILAEALKGNGEMAYKIFKENAPSCQNEKAEIRGIEPYAYGQFTEGPASPHFGRSHVHWLTGTASTVMVGCVEGILGMRPDLNGLRIAPSIPKEWDVLTIEKTFRGKKLHIMIENKGHKESGFHEIELNGKKLNDNYLPEELLEDENEVIVR